MLIYLVYVVEDLIVTAIVAGLVMAWAKSAKGDFGLKVVAGGLLVGAVASIAMAVLKQNTSMIATGDWNMGIFWVSLVAVAVAAICFLLKLAFTRKRAAGEEADEQAGPMETESAGKEKAGRVSLAGVMESVILFALTLFAALRMFYKVPDVINYPFNFNLTNNNVISTDFAYRIIGYVLGLVIVVLAAMAIFKAFKALGRRGLGLSCALVVAIVCYVQMMTCSQIMIARRIIKAKTDAYTLLFPLTTWVSNNIVVFTAVIIAIIIALAVVVIVLSLRDKEPYSNPAEHRKNRAWWRNKRRWAICAIVCLVCSMFIVTAVKAYNEQGPVIVEAEPADVRDGAVYIPLDVLEDGHLHRYAYETEAGFTTSSGYQTQGGVKVRVIAIKKPGSNAYGIGLDACDICGTTGYYERDGQVVCSKCDVVMNINTIGFKGGCNPIVIDYSIGDGYVKIPVEALLEYEKIPGSSW